MDITTNVIEVLRELSGEENILPTHSLQNDLALDSLSMVMLLLALEDKFKIELNESDMNPYDLLTVSDVVSLVERYYKVYEE